MPDSRILALLGAAFCFAFAQAAGCVVKGFDLVDSTAGSGGQAGSGGAGGAMGGSGGASCQSARWPEPPATADPGPNDVDFVVAARTFDFGEEDLTRGPIVGFDLDNRCTCLGDGLSCKEPAYATADHCDGPGGRDNAVAQLFSILGQYDEDFTGAHYTQRAEEGNNTLLIRVRDYNGQANDDQITVSIHPSPGLDADPCGVSMLPAKWDGTDAWPVAASSLVPVGTGGSGGSGAGGSGGTGGAPPCNPAGWSVDDARYRDDQAYVSNWQLVANLPEVALEFVSDDDAIPVQLTAGFVVARIVDDSGGWQLREGTLAGRWKLSEFFKMLGTITNNQLPICTDTGVYDLLKNAVCQYPDIASALGGPTTPCDALSTAVGFNADPALFGSVHAGAGAQRLCPMATDPQYDGCDNP